jgi:2-methylcitrate dehydratase PrpD
MTVLVQLAELLVSLRERSPSPNDRERLAIHVLDTVGSWIAGSATEEGIKLSRLKSPSAHGIPLLGNDPLDRIALGVATVRLTEIDDIHMASCTTPSSVVVPICLTLVARSAKPDAESFVQALCSGYEIMTRLGVAVDGPRIVYRGIWPTFLAAPMAAAAVTAGILSLDATKTANALAIALSLTSGTLGAPIGQSPRWLFLGLAARNGCSAALMANDGYAGDQTLLDGDWMARRHGISWDVRTLLAAQSEGSVINTVSLKPYCAAKQCIAAIEAFRNLLIEGITIGEIATARVCVPPVYAAMIAHGHAADGRVPRITSAAYNLALAAYRPGELTNISRPNLTADPQIAALMNRIEVCPDDELSQHYPRHWPARVDAVLKNGRSVSNRVLDAPGDPAKAIARSEALEKFHRLTDTIMGRRKGVELAQACLGSIEHIDALARLCAWVNT